MDGKQEIEVGNARVLHEAGIRLLERAREITAGSGENARSMDEVGKLLQEMAASGVLDELIARRPGGRRAMVDVIAQHADGSMLSFYAMEDWQSPPSTDVHWHNYWQTLLVVEGSWPDTVWRPVTVADGVARDIILDRREIVAEGSLQKLGPFEPHGWIAEETRRTDRALLLMWSADAEGMPRTVLDPDTGKLTDEFGFLNPAPGTATARASTFSYNRF